MIQSKSDLSFYISEDNKQYFENRGILKRLGGGVKDAILLNEKFLIHRFKVELRKVEYYRNVRKDVIGKMMFLWHFFLFKRLSWKLKCVIFPNTVGPGLKFYHIGSFIHIGENCHIGKNLSFPGGVVLGKGKGGICEVTIGDNCFIGINTTILGKVNIGNNVTIGAHSLVLSDIPDNAVAVGSPAKVIKINDRKIENQ